MSGSSSRIPYFFTGGPQVVYVPWSPYLVRNSLIRGVDTSASDTRVLPRINSLLSADSLSGYDPSSEAFRWGLTASTPLPSSLGCTTDEATERSQYPPAIPDDPETVRLRDGFLRAGSTQRERLLDQLRDGKSSACTSALGSLVPRLTGTAQAKVRAALEERLTGMTPVALRVKLDDPNPEVRRAAAQACAARGDAVQVPALIARLEAEADGPALQAVAAALKGLTARDLDLPADAGAEAPALAVRECRDWWNAQEGKSTSR